MNKFLKTLGLSSAAAFILSLSAHAVTTTSTYNGDGKSDFDGAIGNGMLTFSSDGTTLTGTITNGNTISGFNDTLVIYIDDVAGGFANTSTFTDSGTPAASDNLRASISGYNGTTRAPLTFATGFTADYAIAFGPTSANFGAVFTLNSTTFVYDGSIASTNTGSATAATYTFTLPLSAIGSPASFKFASTYLNGGTATGANAFRSNEAFGNTITDVTNPANTGSVGADTALASFVTFPVPEPGTWAMLLGGAVVLIGLQRSRRRI